MKLNSLALTLLSFCAIACGGSTDPIDEVAAPKFVSVSPANGTADVAVTGLSVVFSYDQNIKCPLDKQKLITISPEATISSVGSYGRDLTVKIGELEGGTQYTVTVPDGTVYGFQNGQPAAAKTSVSFTTKAKAIEVPIVDPDVIPTRGNSIAWQMCTKLGAGWNLGNQMDAYVNDVANETCWGNAKCTLETFKALKADGFKTVRVPITWMGHIGAAPDYKIEESWMNRVAEIVGYAESVGLICIINTHHDENHKASAAHWLDIKSAAESASRNEEIKAEIKAVWTQIAEKFKTKGDWLIYESFNEINDGGWGWSDAFLKNPQKQYDILNEWNQVFVDAVRATGGNNAGRWLGVPGYATSPSLTIKGLVLPKDSATDRIMVAVHSYDPSEFTGAGTTVKYEEWGHTGTNKPSSDEKTLRTMMAQLYEAYIAKGIPCYFGECGCVNKTTERGTKFQKYYLEYFSKAANTYGLPCIIWDNGALSSGETFGYIHHGTGAYIGNGSTVIPGFIKGQSDTSEKYTLESVYTNAPK